MTVPTVVCVLRSLVKNKQNELVAGEYNREHVISLATAVYRWWPKGQPLRFVALTDTPIDSPLVEERRLRHNWPGWWAKMELFEARQDDLGDILYFDLDTMIVGPLDDLVKTEQLTLLRDFCYQDKVASGLMYLPLASRPDTCAAWSDVVNYASPKFPGPGDGDYLNMLWGRQRAVARWQDVLPGQICSYKVDIRQRKGQTTPTGVSVICFHGRPRPWSTSLWTRDK